MRITELNQTKQPVVRTIGRYEDIDYTSTGRETALIGRFRGRTKIKVVASPFLKVS